MGKEVVFLTGSTGFLGSYLLKILLENELSIQLMGFEKMRKKIIDCGRKGEDLS